MSVGLVGRKCGMTRIFRENGDSVPVTVIEALPNRVTTVKTAERDGYRAVQVTVGAAPKAHRHDEGRSRPLRAGEGRAGPRALGVPARRRRGRGARARRRAQGRPLQEGPVRRRQRHHEGQGLRGRHQAPPLLAPVHVARQLAVAPRAGLHRSAPNAGPRVPGQADGGPPRADERARRSTSRSSRRRRAQPAARQGRGAGRENGRSS